MKTKDELLLEYRESLTEILVDLETNKDIKKMCTCPSHEEFIEELENPNEVITICNYHMLLFSIDEAVLDLKTLLDVNNIKENKDINW